MRYKAWECYDHHKGKNGNGCKQGTVKEDKIFEVIEEILGAEVTEESITCIKRVIITGDKIAVEKV